MDFSPADRGLFTPYWGVWPATWERWKAEGLGNRHWAEPFGFDVSNQDAAQFAFVPVNTFLWPPLEVQVLREEPERRLIRDEWGVTRYIRTDGIEMSQYVAWPVSDESSWQKLRDRLLSRTPGRLPHDLISRAALWRDRDSVLGIGGRPMGLFSAIRELMGPEAAMIACALEPGFVRRMAEHLTDLWVDLFAKVLDRVQPDFLFLWELICNNKGPMISPAMFRDLFLPSYRKLIGEMKWMGVRNVWIDCQGRNWEMLPIFLEAGATGTLPAEVRAGMDVVEIRRRFPRLQLIGGIERMALVRGRSDIDMELERVGPLVPLGGYIPSIDHAYSPDIPWDNFMYFIDGLRRITSVPICPSATCAT